MNLYRIFHRSQNITTCCFFFQFNTAPLLLQCYLTPSQGERLWKQMMAQCLLERQQLRDEMSAIWRRNLGGVGLNFGPTSVRLIILSPNEDSVSISSLCVIVRITNETRLDAPRWRERSGLISYSLSKLWAKCNIYKANINLLKSYIYWT